MKKPAISILIPVYNGEKTIRQCLNSVIGQTYKDFEIVVVDNNSTDKTKLIIMEFVKKNPKVRYAFEPKRSRGAARNKGVLESKADIIAMTDSDCVVGQDWLLRLTKPIRDRRESIVQGNEQDLVGNYWTRMQQHFNQEYLKNESYDENYVNHLDTKNFCIFKDKLQNVGMFNSTIGNLEDFELKIKLKKDNQRIYFLKDLKVKHHHKDSFIKLFKRRINQGYWTARIFGLHKRYFEEHPDNMVEALNPYGYFIFFPSLLPLLFKKGFANFAFEFVTGIAWRIGIVGGLLHNKH
jgi:glycosyltransferase involved in cell wall biosynthesis